jgi:hypothetical protein
MELILILLTISGLTGIGLGPKATWDLIEAEYHALRVRAGWVAKISLAIIIGYWLAVLGLIWFWKSNLKIPTFDAGLSGLTSGVMLFLWLCIYFWIARKRADNDDQRKKISKHQWMTFFGITGLSLLRAIVPFALTWPLILLPLSITWLTMLWWYLVDKNGKRPKFRGFVYGMAAIALIIIPTALLHHFTGVRTQLREAIDIPSSKLAEAATNMFDAPADFAAIPCPGCTFSSDGTPSNPNIAGRKIFHNQQNLVWYDAIEGRSADWKGWKWGGEYWTPVYFGDSLGFGADTTKMYLVHTKVIPEKSNRNRVEMLASISTTTRSPTDTVRTCDIEISPRDIWAGSSKCYIFPGDEVELLSASGTVVWHVDSLRAHNLTSHRIDGHYEVRPEGAYEQGQEVVMEGTPCDYCPVGALIVRVNYRDKSREPRIQGFQSGAALTRAQSENISLLEFGVNVADPSVAQGLFKLTLRITNSTGWQNRS